MLGARKATSSQNRLSPGRKSGLIVVQLVDSAESTGIERESRCRASRRRELPRDVPACGRAQRASRRFVHLAKEIRCRLLGVIHCSLARDWSGPRAASSCWPPVPGLIPPKQGACSGRGATPAMPHPTTHRTAALRLTGPAITDRPQAAAAPVAGWAVARVSRVMPRGAAVIPVDVRRADAPAVAEVVVPVVAPADVLMAAAHRAIAA